MDRPGSEGRIETLDMLRGLAIVLVVLFHFTARLTPDMLNAAEPAMPPVFFGWIGVYLFFAISGYCILLTIRRSTTISQFLVRRVSRIYPAYLVAIALTLAFMALVPVPRSIEQDFHAIAISPRDIVLNIFLLGQLGEWVNGSFWSIAAEMKFYLLLAAIAFLARDIEKTIMRFSWFALGLGGLWILARSGEMLLSGTHRLATLLDFAAIASYAPFFAIGMLASGGRKNPADGEVLLRLLVLESLVIIGMEATGLARFGDAVPALVTIAVFVVLLFALLRMAGGKALPHVPVLTPLLARLGYVSFSWYLVHEVIGLSLMARFNLWMPPPLSMLFAVGLTLALAFAFSLAVEWRFRKPLEHLIGPLFAWIGARLASLRPKAMIGPAE